MLSFLLQQPVFLPILSSYSSSLSLFRSVLKFWLSFLQYLSALVAHGRPVALHGITILAEAVPHVEAHTSTFLSLSRLFCVRDAIPLEQRADERAVAD